MNTGEFITALREAGDRSLVFVNVSGDRVHPGYHLTEIKAVAYETVDCGGQTNHWNETIFQLWVPQDADDQYMSAAKFVQIFDRVQSLVPLDLNADARIEYGDDSFFPSIYSVEAISQTAGELSVSVTPPITTCKARDRRAMAGEETCCS